MYPALHRLEERGWVTAAWGASDANRRAKFYALSKWPCPAARRNRQLATGTPRPVFAALKAPAMHSNTPTCGNGFSAYSARIPRWTCGTNCRSTSRCGSVSSSSCGLSHQSGLANWRCGASATTTQSRRRCVAIGERRERRMARPEYLTELRRTSATRCGRCGARRGSRSSPLTDPRTRYWRQQRHLHRRAGRPPRAAAVSAMPAGCIHHDPLSGRHDLPALSAPDFVSVRRATACTSSRSTVFNGRPRHDARRRRAEGDSGTRASAMGLLRLPVWTSRSVGVLAGGD